MTRRLPSLIVLLLLMSCRGTGLEEMSYEEYKAKLSAGELPDLTELIIRDEHGHRISLDSFITLQKAHDYYDRFYKNDQGEIVEYQLIPKPAFRDLPVDCDAVESIMDSVYVVDQSIRTRETYDPRQDYANLEMVVNIMEQCGIPASPTAVKTIFLVVQHNHNSHQKKYIEAFRAAANEGLLSKSTLALMEDRLLVDDGKPQLYGTQVRRGGQDEPWEVCEIFEPEKVDQRRASVGLGPLAEYLRNFGIVFDVEQVHQ